MWGAGSAWGAGWALGSCPTAAGAGEAALGGSTPGRKCRREGLLSRGPRGTHSFITRSFVRRPHTHMSILVANTGFCSSVLAGSTLPRV